MLGHRNPQRSLFSAQSLPHQVAPDSFYGRMGAISHQLFQDDDLRDMYCADNGRPSLPPSLMSGVLLLQFHDDATDGEAVERTRYDLRWKVALDLPLDFPGFDPSSLSVYRQRLVEHGQERYAFDRFVAVGRQAGFLPDKVTLLTDTTWVKGPGRYRIPIRCCGRGSASCSRHWGIICPVGGRVSLSECENWWRHTWTRIVKPRSTGQTRKRGPGT